MRAKLFRDVPLARTGTQTYAGQELGISGGMVEVDRPVDEVRRSVPTFEGTPLTMGHPPELLDAGMADVAVGLVSGVRFDGQQVRGDLLVWDDAAVQAIKQGKRELSAGYEAEYTYEGDGYVQRDIRGNHVALVPRGRSGAAQRIGG